MTAILFVVAVMFKRYKLHWHPRPNIAVDIVGIATFFSSEKSRGRLLSFTSWQEICRTRSENLVGQKVKDTPLVLRGTTVLPRHRGTIFLRYQYRRLYGTITAIPQLPRFFGTVLSDVDIQ